MELGFEPDLLPELPASSALERKERDKGTKGKEGERGNGEQDRDSWTWNVD